MLMEKDDAWFMGEALKEARQAFEKNEVPIGAVIVCKKKIIARAHNQVELLNDATAHAEILALTSASAFLGSKYLPEAQLYVTLEPCLMCAAAIFWAKLGGLVYGAADNRYGFSSLNGKILHPKTRLATGIRAEECGGLMREFFKTKRKL